jgi:hypothetical protein
MQHFRSNEVGFLVLRVCSNVGNILDFILLENEQMDCQFDTCSVLHDKYFLVHDGAAV